MKKEKNQNRTFSINPRTILLLVVATFVVVFLVSNSEPLSRNVSFQILDLEIENLLGVWFVLSFALGFLAMFLFTLKALYVRRKIIKGKDKEIKELMNELSRYRNQGLEEIEDADEARSDEVEPVKEEA